MYPSLKGKVAIVTGAAGMVGAGIAKRFALEGTRVAAVDVDHDGVRRAAEEISSDTGGDVRPYGADISSRGDVRRTVEEVVGRWSRVDILVNNAGVLRADFIEDLGEEDWELTLAVNGRGAVLCCQAVVPYMKRSGWGRIINISSNSGIKGSAGLHPYSFSKGGIIAFTQGLAAELGPFGITVNAVCPGDIPSAGVWNEKLFRITMRKLGVSTREEVERRLAESVPLKRLCRVEDIANLVAFLASDQASYITGQAIAVNGGKIMR